MIVFTKKKIGILGGMGPEATADLYFRIIRIFQKKYGAKYDNDFPEILIYNLPLPDVVEKPKQEKKIKELLLQSVKKLESFDVDLIAIPCNTVSYFISDMRNAASVPILSIPEETAEQVRKLGLTKIGLLGTAMTISKNIYGVVLKDIEIINPTKKQQKKITKVILNILSGRKTKEDRQVILSIIKELQFKGAKKVILGCTELPLLIRRRFGTINTIDILAKAVVEETQKNATKLGKIYKQHQRKLNIKGSAH